MLGRESCSGTCPGVPGLGYASGPAPYISGNWFFPNKTRVSTRISRWDFYRSRSQMVVRMHRKRDGVEGIYCCEIPDSMNVTRTMYIGVYTTSVGE